MTESIWSFDAETHATADLKKVGAARYLTDPDTDVILFAYHPVGHPDQPRVWHTGDPVPPEIIWHVQNGGYFSGWNVTGFDRTAWDEILVKRHGFPSLDGSRWLDSMHLAAAANLPRSLDGCAKAVGAPYQADLKDNHVLRRITNKAKTPIIQGADLTWLTNRCVQDVLMEEETLRRLPPWFTMPPWNRMREIDRKINERGILMDVELVRGLEKAATEETKRLDAKMRDLTGGVVRSTSVIEALKKWLMQEGVELPRKDEKPDDEEDVDEDDDKNDSAYRLRKSDIADLLAKPDLPPHCRQALEWRAEAAKASVKKLHKMLECMSPDGRLRGALILGGAQTTMRFSGAAWQPQNFVRDAIGNGDHIETITGFKKKENPDEFKRVAGLVLNTAVQIGKTGDRDLIETICTVEREDAQKRKRTEGVLPWIGRMLRRTLTAPEGKLFLNGDYSQIEARIPVWIAGQTDKVEAFRSGKDIYRLQAAPIFEKAPEELSSTERQVGKTTILACIAEGSLVETDRGLVPIEQVTVDDKVWDGVCWVSQEGPVFQGYQEVIDYDGLTATPDHMVYVEGSCGKVPFGFAAACKIPLLRSGNGWNRLRESKNNISGKNMDSGRETVRVCSLRNLRDNKMDLSLQPEMEEKQRLSGLFQTKAHTDRNVSVPVGCKVEMRKSDSHPVQELWIARYTIQLRFCNGGWVMDPGKSRTEAAQRRNRPDKQQRSLRTREYSLGVPQGTNTKHAPIQIYSVPGAYDTFRPCFPCDTRAKAKSKIRGHNAKTIFEGVELNRRYSDSARQPPNIVQTRRAVWDLYKAGPHNRFTVSSRLVSNCGFAGGVGAFVPMAMIYGLTISKEEAAPIVKAYREDNPRLVEFWDANMNAAVSAVMYPGSTFYVPPYNLIAWCLDGACLCCRLPSGRLLRYWSPRLEQGYWQDGTPKSSLDLTNLVVKGRAVFRRTTWRGTAVENLTQAIAVDLLAQALCNMEDAGLPVVLHVHDSITAEVPSHDAERLFPIFEQAMLSQPAWTAGLPIAASCDISSRFG